MSKSSRELACVLICSVAVALSISKLEAPTNQEFSPTISESVQSTVLVLSPWFPCWSFCSWHRLLWNSIGWFRWRRWSTKEGRDSENWCVYMCLSFVPKFFNFVWGSRLPSPRILNEAGVWVEGLDIFLINHESAKDKCECPGKNCCGDDSLVCDVKTRTCKPSLGSVCSTSYFFTECASKDTYNVSTECALSAAGYHRCCIKSGQPLALTTYTDECCWGKKGNVCKWDPDDGFLGNDSVPSTWARSRRKTLAWQRFSRNTSRIHRFKSCHTFHLVCFIFWSAQIFKSVSHTFHLFLRCSKCCSHLFRQGIGF